MLSTSQDREALGISYHAARRLLNRLYPLPCAFASPSAKGGGREKLYAISVVLPRVKDAGFTDTFYIRSLFKKGNYPWAPTT